MFLRIVGIVFPIFIIMMIGFADGRRHQPEMQAANQFNMAVFLPALIFSALAGKSFKKTAVDRLMTLADLHETRLFCSRSCSPFG